MGAHGFKRGTIEDEYGNGNKIEKNRVGKLVSALAGDYLFIASTTVVRHRHNTYRKRVGFMREIRFFKSKLNKQD